MTEDTNSHDSQDEPAEPTIAEAIPGARLLLVDGMGHDMPRPLWPKLVDAIAENAARATAPEEVAASAR